MLFLHLSPLSVGSDAVHDSPFGHEAVGAKLFLLGALKHEGIDRMPHRIPHHGLLGIGAPSDSGFGFSRHLVNDPSHDFHCGVNPLHKLVGAYHGEELVGHLLNVRCPLCLL